MLNNKVIIVTGGAGLLGRVFIKAIVENGGIGIIADINKENGKKTMQELKNETGSNGIDFVHLDITSNKSINNMIESLLRKYHKIDALVNNAYPRNNNYGRKFESVTFEDFCDNVNSHLGGYFLTSQQMALYFKNQGYGNIINIASIYGVIAPRFEIYEGTSMTSPVEYSVIKSALIQLTKYMAKYLKGTNIRVNAISPGGIFDNQPDMFLKNYSRLSLSKGMLRTEDLKGTILFLLSDESTYVNGQNIVIDDGFSL